MNVFYLKERQREPEEREREMGKTKPNNLSFFSSRNNTSSSSYRFILFVSFNHEQTYFSPLVGVTFLYFDV